jgi:hypothetical protein
MTSVNFVGNKPSWNWLDQLQILPILTISHGTVFGLVTTHPLPPVLSVLERTLRVPSPWIWSTLLAINFFQLTPSGAKPSHYYMFGGGFNCRTSRPLPPALAAPDKTSRVYSKWIQSTPLAIEPPRTFLIGFKSFLYWHYGENSRASHNPTGYTLPPVTLAFR